MSLSDRLRKPMDKDDFCLACDAVEEMEIRKGELELDIKSGDMNYKELVDSFDKMVKTYSKTLSRRDQMAMAAMTGFLSSANHPINCIPIDSIKIADALILELDREGV